MISNNTLDFVKEMALLSLTGASLLQLYNNYCNVLRDPFNLLVVQSAR